MDIRKFMVQRKRPRLEIDPNSNTATNSAVINDETPSTSAAPCVNVESKAQSKIPESCGDGVLVSEFYSESSSKNVQNEPKSESKCEPPEQNMESVACTKDLSTSADSASTETPSSSSEISSTDRSCFQHLHISGKHHIVCQPCASHHALLQQFSQSLNRKIPSIAQPNGTLYRENTIVAHLKQPYHQAAVKASRLESLDPVEVLKSTAIGQHISKQNEALANKIGKLMLHVYCDAKKLTLSALSYPARIIAAEIANAFSFNSDHSSTDAIKNFDFQYVTPAFHLEALKFIVSSYREIFMKDVLENSLAISLRCDGSVDALQIDKLYVMAKCVFKNGEVKDLFLGAAEPQMRGAEGILQSVKSAINSTLDSKSASHRILEKTSSLVTDGASVNIGCKNGLWELFKKEKDTKGESYAFVTFWCAVHRSSLAWKEVTKDVQEVSHLITELSSISTFFHESAIRTRELKDVGEQENVNVVHHPKYFDIRWAEFTENLFNAVLTNWLALTIYFQKNQDSSKQCAGYLNMLTKEGNLKLIAEVADILSIFSRYQKNLQANSTTIVDIGRYTDTLRNQLDNLRTVKLVGGWVSAIDENLKNRNSKENTVQLHGITLQGPKPKRRKEHHLYVTDQRSSDAIVNDLIESLKNFLDKRLSLDDNIVTHTTLFVTLQPDVSLPEVHKIWAPDLNLQELGLQYSDILQHKEIEKLRRNSLKQLVEFLVVSDIFDTLTLVMARILAAKPHSADVERLISANNKLKPHLRNRMNQETENLNLFVHINMPVLEKWDPRNAVLEWISDKHHRVKETPKARTQVWFKHVFPEAVEAGDVEDKTSEENGPKTKKPVKKMFVKQ